jgi:hypothetical protein
MANDALSAFIERALREGETKSRIADALRTAGWEPTEVQRALDTWADTDFPIPVPKPRAYVSGAEGFLYLALFSTLFLVTTDVGRILFAIVEALIPDPSAAAGGEFRPPLRDAVAGIVIAAPVFAFVARTAERAILRNPGRRQSPIRKWLIGLTLFVAASVLIGDLIAVVTAFLSGEVTMRFAAKAAIVGGIAGVIGGYFLRDARLEDTERPPSGGGRLAAIAAAVTVVFALGSGMYLAGSPETARLERSDERRVADLSEISNRASFAWTQRRVLPTSLDSLGQPGSPALRDPDPSRRYEYRVIADSIYEVCAQFDRPALRNSPVRWSHGIGTQCFRETATPLAGNNIAR